MKFEYFRSDCGLYQIVTDTTHFTEHAFRWMFGSPAGGWGKSDKSPTEIRSTCYSTSIDIR